MNPYTVTAVATLVAIAGMLALLAYAVKDADTGEPEVIQRDPRPDALMGEYERELEKPLHVPGEYLS